MSAGPFVVHRHGDGWAVACDEGVLIVTSTQSEALELAADATTILEQTWLETPRRAVEPRSFASDG
ncbi:hypothetical protein [Caulobacter sp. NIBR2454]|uniref:hypothetical protein n=1 Tax=Caulobacter sp. NIBR2454 TaxID=3015996 RepID=UPI0022B678E9|nr:hypothetical protein [Caulobacter sp. NIBR2454]